MSRAQPGIVGLVRLVPYASVSRMGVGCCVLSGWSRHRRKTVHCRELVKAKLKMLSMAAKHSWGWDDVATMLLVAAVIFLVNRHHLEPGQSSSSV